MIVLVVQPNFVHAMDERKEASLAVLNGVIEWLEYEGHSSFLIYYRSHEHNELAIVLSLLEQNSIKKEKEEGWCR